jgi:hypothetical protein
MDTFPQRKRSDLDESLVDEVESMTGVGKRPFGLGGKQGIGEHTWRDTGRNRRQQGALGRFAMAQICPKAQPALEYGRLRPASKRRTLPPPRRLAVTIRRHAVRTAEQGRELFSTGNLESAMAVVDSTDRLRAPTRRAS